MSKYFRLLVFSMLLIFIFSCSEGEKQSNVAQVLVFNAFQNKMTAQLNSKKENKKIGLRPFENSGYLKLSPSLYTFHIKSDGKDLLKQKLGLAKNEKYTVISYGNPKFSSQVNQSNFTHTLHFIFAGADNHTKNGYLPAMHVFRDQIKVKQGYSQIRFFNAALGMAPVSIKLMSAGKKQNIASGLAYAKPLLGKPVKPGDKKVALYLGKSPQPVYITEFHFEAKKVYTIVVFLKNQKPRFNILSNQ